MRFTRFILSVTACIVMLHVSAQGQMWTALAPLPNQAVNTIIEFDNAIYAGTGEGLYRSTDKGQSWENVGDFNNRTIVNLSSSANELFVCPVSAGVWTFANNEWKNISSNLPQQTTIYSVVRKGNSLFAATNFNGVYRSDNNGATWDIVGLPNMEIRSIALSGSILYAGALDFQGDKGSLYRSIDNGNTWIRSDTGLTSTFSKILVLGDNELFVGTLGGGVYISKDSARTWEQRSNGLLNLGVNALIWNKKVLMAGTDAGGAFISRDSGKTWRDANFKLTPRKINDLLFVDNVPYCATNVGVWSCDLSVNSIDDVYDDVSTDWSVMPQPALSTVTLRAVYEMNIASVSMTDVMGKDIRRDISVSNQEILCPVADLPAGMYFVHIHHVSGKINSIPVLKQ